MWKLVTYVTCVVILSPNAHGYVDYTSYLLSRLTEHINQVNHLLKMIYKQRSHQGQPDTDPAALDDVEHEFMYDNALWLTITTLKNSYRVLTKLKNDIPSGLYGNMLPYPEGITPSTVDIEHSLGYERSGRRSSQSGDWSNNFYEALAGAFKKFLTYNPDVRAQLGEDFNADALINPPEPKKKN